MNTWERDAIIRVLTDLIEEGESLLTGVTTSEGEYHWKVGVRRSLELLLGRGAPTVQQITNPFSVSFISPATNVKDALLKLKILKADQELGFLPDNLSAAPPALKTACRSWVYERTRLDILWRYGTASTLLSRWGGPCGASAGGSRRSGPAQLCAGSLSGPVLR